MLTYLLAFVYSKWAHRHSTVVVWNKKALMKISFSPLSEASSSSEESDEEETEDDIADEAGETDDDIADETG